MWKGPTWKRLGRRETINKHVEQRSSMPKNEWVRVTTRAPGPSENIVILKMGNPFPVKRQEGATMTAHPPPVVSGQSQEPKGTPKWSGFRLERPFQNRRRTKEVGQPIPAVAVVSFYLFKGDRFFFKSHTKERAPISHFPSSGLILWGRPC